MRFEVFGDRNKEVILLIHGFGVTWKMWDPQIKAFAKEYHVIVPVLGAHDLEQPREFISVKDEARAIIDYVKANYNGELFAICGSSLGGTIAFEVLAQNQLQIKKAIIDSGTGAPLNKLLVKVVLKSKILSNNKIKEGGEKIRAQIKNSWYPAELMDEVFKVSHCISDQTIKNVCEDYMLSSDIQNTKVDITYWYGSKEEWITKKTCHKLQELVPNATIEIFKGYNHGELVIGNPEKYIEKARTFFNCNYAS
nr:alpha/beta hydrolase [uncultured Niameybacter sp.]